MADRRERLRRLLSELRDVRDYQADLDARDRARLAAFDLRKMVSLCRKGARLENAIADLEFELGE